jgi:SAM-dependent methyltransferase
MKRHAPATDRNRDAIVTVLARVIAPGARVLEIASGTGQHATYFAAHLPGVTWQPSDPDVAARASIAAWIAEAGADNVRAPIALDAASPPWTVDSADAIVCINMVHIAPWAAALGLFAGAGALLAPGAPLVLYGPYRFAGAFTAPSNEAFDRELRQQNPAWGVRDVDDLEAAAGARGFALEDVVAMPANNHCLLFRRT